MRKSVFCSAKVGKCMEFGRFGEIFYIIVKIEMDEI